jgi:hypothetical protein
MTIDAHVLMLFASCSLVAVGFWYQHRIWAERFAYQERMWTERSDLIRGMAQAVGELRAFKNQQIMHHRGKTETGFFLFRRTMEKHLFLEYRDGKLSRAIGDTDDLSVFPELSAEQIATIRQLLGVVARLAANLRSFRWQPHCRALYQTPVAA